MRPLRISTKESWGVVTMQDADLERMAEGEELLPDVVRDAIVAEDKEKFLAEDIRKLRECHRRKHRWVSQGGVCDGGCRS